MKKITDYFKKIQEIRTKKVEKIAPIEIEEIKTPEKDVGFVDRKTSEERIKQLNDRVNLLEKGESEEISEKGGRALHPEFITWGQFLKTASVQIRPGALLSYNQLRRIYRQSSAVRPCVDGIARVVSTFDWNILPKDPLNPNWEHINIVKNFFENPNMNQESLQQIISKFLTDILVLDAGVIEKVRSLSGKMLEILVRDGSTFRPVTNKHALLEGYIQTVQAQTVPFSSKDIVYLMLYPRSDSNFGTPIIDTIVDEVASLLFSNQYIAASFTEDEIPPGILNLGKIGKEAYQRAREDFQEKRGKQRRFKMSVIHGTDTVKYIPLKTTNEELELDELRKSIEKIVYRNFGVSPTEMGVTEKTPRATAQVQLEVSTSKLIYPIVKLINYFFNIELIPEFGFDDVYFKLVSVKQEAPYMQARTDEIYLKGGAKTIDEVRTNLGLAPYKKGGDRPFIVVGQQVLYLDEMGTSKTKTKEIPEEEEIREEEESEEEKEASERAPPNPNAIDLGAIKELEKKYGEELRKEWNIAREKSLKNPKKAEEIISEMGDKWIELSEFYFPIAYSLGQDSACQILESSPQVTLEKSVSSLEERISWNKKFVKESLEKALIEKSTKLIEKIEYVEKVEYEDMGEVFDSLESRVPHYEHAIYSVAGNGMQNEFNVLEEQILYYWTNTSGHPCSDCADLAAGSPYLKLDVLPGDGYTKCGGWCYCQIIIHRTGEPKLPPTIAEPPQYMIPPKSPKITNSKIPKSSIRAKKLPMSYSEIDKILYKKIPPKVLSKLKSLFHQPRFKSLMLRKEFLEGIQLIKIDPTLGTLEFAGEWDPIRKIILLNPFYVDIRTLSHEISHCIARQAKFGFSTGSLFIRETAERVRKSYQKSLLKFSKVAKQAKGIPSRVSETYRNLALSKTYGKNWFRDIPEWDFIKNIELRKSGVYRTYGLKNPSEYIAVGFEAYITDPRTLQIKDKGLYDLIQEFFSKGVLKE